MLPPIIVYFYMMFRKLKTNKPEVITISLISIYYLFLHSYWIHWHGGSSWGPRLLHPIVPPLYLFIDLNSKNIKRIFIAATILGYVVSMPNLYSYSEHHNAELVDAGLKPEWDYAWSINKSLLTNIWGSSFR